MTAQQIKPAFSDNALTVLGERYLLPGETPEGLIERVSFGNSDYQEMMARLDFLPNSPTLFNAGTDDGTLSACFKFDVPDDLAGIMDVARKAAMVLKFGGGVGYTLSALRPKGAPVRTTHKVAGGPVAFMSLYHAVAMSITQGGKRAGAQMAILHCDHPDVEDFIRAKDDEAKAATLSTFNISVAATDDWMRRANPRNLSEGKRGEESRLFDLIVDGAWRTGDPGFYFIDTSERSNPTPWIGKLTGTNPCGEVPLRDNEACNLGSIVLSHMFRPDAYKPDVQLDWGWLERTTRLATRYLDDVLDHNQFPDPAITAAVAETRKLGLGVMGWADLLCLLNIHYDTDQAVALGEEIATKIAGWSLQESIALGREKGQAPAYDSMPESLAREWTGDKPRNTTRTCIAPTGSIAILADSSGGIEPHFALQTVRKMGKGGTLSGTVLTQDIPVLSRSGGFIPKTTNDIRLEWHIKHQAAWQRHVDLAVSKTINLPKSATHDDIRTAYILAWEHGCKGITVYRDGCRSEQVLNNNDGGREQFIPAESLSGAISRIVDKASANGTSYLGGRPSEPHVKPHAIRILEQVLAFIKTDGLRPGAESLMVEAGELIRGWTTMDLSDLGAFDPPSPVNRRHMPDERQSITHKFLVADQEGYLTVGLYPDKTPGEIFITCNKTGTTVSGLLDAWAISISRSLQWGIPFDELFLKFVGLRFEPAGMTGNRAIPTATSIIDYIARWLLLKFNSPIMATQPMQNTGLLCPECGSMAIALDGCLRCSTSDCGWERCG